MLDARKKIIIGGGVILGLLILFLVVVLVLAPGGPDNAQPEAPEVTDVQPSVPAPLPGDQVVRTAPEGETDERTAPKQAARIFVERFGTYSNQNKNEHIALVLPATTEVMADWINTQTVPQQGPFVGMTTEVLSSSIISLSDTAAEVAIQVRRVREENNTVTSEVKSGTVELINTGDNVWLVDGLFYD